MYFGKKAFKKANIISESVEDKEILEESNKGGKDKADTVPARYGTLISHLQKYGVESKKHAQDASWVISVLDNFNDIEELKKPSKLGEKKVSRIFHDKKDEILKNANKKLKTDGNEELDDIPEEFSYEFLSDKDKVVDYLINNAQTMSSINLLTSRGYEDRIPPEIYKRCKNYK